MDQKIPPGAVAFFEECKKRKVSLEENLEFFRSGALGLWALAPGGVRIDESGDYMATLERMIAELAALISKYEAEHHA